MFASKVAKPQTKKAARSTNSQMSPRPKSGVRPAGYTAVEQAHVLQRTRSELTPPPLLSQRGHSPSSVAATAPGAVQTKLVVGSVNDPLEHEADRTADLVMRMSDASATAGSGANLQRRCAGCEGEEAVETSLAKQHGGKNSSGAEAPAVVTEVLRAAGQPMDAQARGFFEPRFGRDFSQVRIHADERAARSAQSIGARAYTVGGHIAFAQGQYAPGSDHGRHLLAHELTHTIQQGAARIQRRPSAIQQGVVGLADNLEEISHYEEAAGAAQQVIRRSATWMGATVHETLNVADIAFGGDSPITWHLLNGTKLATEGNADAAIKIPHITIQPLPSTDPAATWMAQVDIVPDQKGSGDETVLGPGPWTKVVTKAQAGGVTRSPACTGAGNSTFTANGKPSDAAVYQANRRHEDHHLADHKVAFEDAIGKWDTKLQDAKTAGTRFTGASAADATNKLWAAMGNTPANAARDYRAQGFAKGHAYHTTAKGKPMALSNAASNADCSTSSADVTNPS
jgi:hypothetical protein